MTNKDKYNLVFQKQYIRDKFHYFAISKNKESNDLAYHLTCSGKIDAKAQLEELLYSIENPQFEGFSGDFLGSTLEIHPSSGIAEVGDGGATIPIPDLTGLIEEWLAFIS